MKKTGLWALLLIILASCGSNNSAPDVSHIDVNIQTQRFDQDFFSIDTMATEAGISRLAQKYPTLLPLYLQNILGTGDSTMVRRFLSVTRPVYNQVQQLFPDFKSEEQEIQNAYKYVKYYFPAYATPRYIRTIVGPVDAMASMRNGDQTPDFLAPDFAGISLQFYLGKDYELYQQEYFITNIAPLYRSRRFEKQYITADLMKLVADDVYPDSSRGRSLLEQMIEKGKQWYLLDHFMPSAADSIITGYTNDQVEWCEENEGLIWNRLLSENLYGIEPDKIQTYIGESPFTMNMPAQSPGNIGQWVGWRIVQEYARKNDQSLQQVISTPFKTIFEKAGYKPK